MVTAKQTLYRDITSAIATSNVVRRDKIMAHISAHPGSTIPTIANALRMPRYFVFADLTALVRSGRLVMVGDSACRGSK